MKEVKDEFETPELHEEFKMSVKTERPDIPDDSAGAFDSYEGNDRCSSDPGKFNLVFIADNAPLKNPPKKTPKKTQQQKR